MTTNYHTKIRATTLIYVFISIFVGGLSGCDRIYRMLDKNGAEEKELIGEVLPFEQNPTVLEIQTLLKVYGYDPGRPDGVLGLRTREAIARFQRENGLELTRFVDQQTWVKLKYFKDKEWIVNGKLNVVKVQEALKNAGFVSGRADGVIGEKTKQAIKNFQLAHKLGADGKVGYKTLKELDKYLVTVE